MRVAIFFLALGLTLPVIAEPAARSCIRGTVFNGGDRVPNARLRLVSPQVDISTFTRADGGYAVCAEDGRYAIEIYWGKDVFTGDEFPIRGDEQRDVRLETLRRRAP